MDPGSTTEVPRERWVAYFTQIEALQRDRPVQVELVGPEIGDQPLTQNALLRGISAAEKGAFAGTIEIIIGVNDRVDHRVIHPSHVYAMQAPSGGVDCLDIEDEDRTKTLIRFQEPLYLRAGAHVAPSATREVFVRDYMTLPAQVITSGSLVSESLELMQRHRIRHLAVVGPDERLLGILSDRDLYVAKREQGGVGEDVSVDEVMVRSPYTVSPGTRLDEAAAVMAKRKYGCAVVVEEGRIVGMLTTTDALRALVDLRAEARGEWLA